jgi:hypothetical protein
LLPVIIARCRHGGPVSKSSLVRFDHKRYSVAVKAARLV